MLPSVVWVVVSLVLKLLREVLADKLKQSQKKEDNATEIHSEKTLCLSHILLERS